MALAAALVTLTAMGDTITYTVTGTVSGTLGISAFSNEFITITTVSDTSLVQSSTSPAPTYSNANTTTFTLGAYSGSFVGTYGVFSADFAAFMPSTPYAVGIADLDSFRAVLAPALHASAVFYDLISDYTYTGPAVTFDNGGAIFPTTLGNLIFSSVTGNSTFTAAVSSSAVPEIDPVGMAPVLALVTGALGLLERRRVKTA